MTDYTDMIYLKNFLIFRFISKPSTKNGNFLAMISLFGLSFLLNTNGSIANLTVCFTRGFLCETRNILLSKYVNL